MTLTTITATEASMTAELAEREGALSWWVVRGGVVVARYATVGQARRAVDRRDARYGAAVHSYVHASWSAR